MPDAKPEEPKSYEALQEALFGAGANSSGGLPPGTSKEAFHADAQKLQRRLNKMWAGLLDPMSKFMERWDLVLIGAMIFTAFITPAELAFGIMRDPLVVGYDTLFWFNQIVNLIFWIDITFQFFLPIRARDGRTIRSHRRIAYFYCTGWFSIDLVSVLPIDVLETAGAFESLIASGNQGLTKAIRVVRLLKLLKLLRVLRASRVLNRFQTRVAMTYTTSEMAKYIIIIVITLHWFACAWAGLATFTIDDPRTDALKAAIGQRQEVEGVLTCPGCALDDDLTDPACVADCLTRCEVEVLAQLHGVSTFLVHNRQHWMCRAADLGQIPADFNSMGSFGVFLELYGYCLVVALGQLSGGAITAAPQNLPENIIFVLAMLAGSVIWAIVQGVVCGIITVGDPHYIEHRQNMDQLNFLMADMGVNQEVKIRVREYYQFTLALLRRQSYPKILDLLSPMLMTDVCMRMASWVTNSIEWMRYCEDDFLRDLFRRMLRESFAVKEKIHAGRLNVLNLGVVARGGKFLVPGTDRGPVWGDILLSAPALRNMAPARALTYVEVTTLEREDLEAVCVEYPESAKEVRRAAMTAALIKATELINAQVRRKRETKRRKSVSASERGRLERQAQMQSAFGGGDDSPGGYENEDPDDVLRMICGVGGMTYREVENGQIVGGNEEASADGGGGKGSGNASIDRLFDEVKAMREEQQSDAAFTARRIEKLEVAMMRSNGMEQRDPSALVRRPHVQRALRVCAVLNTALHHWRRRARDLHLLGAAWERMADKHLLQGWNTWLDYAVRRLYYSQCVLRAMHQPLARAFDTWAAHTDMAIGAATGGELMLSPGAAGALMRLPTREMAERRHPDVMPLTIRIESP